MYTPPIADVGYKSGIEQLGIKVKVKQRYLFRVQISTKHMFFRLYLPSGRPLSRHAAYEILGLGIACNLVETA